jgi:AraC-like DNA-binding protein
MELLAHARIVMWEGASLWVVDATQVKSDAPRQTDFHAHHAVQVTLSLGGWFKLATEQSLLGGDGAAIAADVEHVFEAEGLIALLFVEPEGRFGRAMDRALFARGALTEIALEPVAEICARIRENFRAARRDDESLVALGRALVAALAGAERGREPDVRVRRVIAWAAGQLDRGVSLGDAVRVAGISASRLRHLFVEQTGLPFKTYLLWLRLTRSVERIAAGASLTEAAHGAGFSDSAHLSRTFRRMFGIAPTALRMS